MYKIHANKTKSKCDISWAPKTFILEETIVTATKRAERLQDIPQSISAYSEQDLNFMGARNFSDMIESVPGVELRNTQAGDGSVKIRGIAEMSSVGGGPGASVGYYLDEMPLTMASYFPDVASFDMARIEVLRGPQGTLCGLPFPPGSGGPTWITPNGAYFDQTINSEAIGQELRLVSNGDGPWQWVAGLFYKNQKYGFYGNAYPTPPSHHSGHHLLAPAIPPAQWKRE